MLRICIGGLTDSGKTTIGDMLSKDLNIMHVTKYITETYKDFKVNEHKHSEEGKILQTANKDNAKNFDDEVLKLSSENDCVVSTWLGAWIVKDPTIRVWLDASLDERIRRCSNERKLSMDDASKYVDGKDKTNIKAFKELYNIDIIDHKDFDMIINTDRVAKDETVSLISMLALGREKQRFR